MGVANYGKIKTLHNVFVKNFKKRENFLKIKPLVHYLVIMMPHQK